MDVTRNLIWPLFGTGADLARLLKDAANDGANRLHGSPAELIDGYLTWVADQTRMLQGRLSPSDLDRLLTSPRYWATFASPTPTPSTVSAIREEMQFRMGLMTEAAKAVDEASQWWRPTDGHFASLVVVDTNFWVECSDSFGSIDWHELIASADGPSSPSLQDELRLVVPMVVVDELDGLAHKGQERHRVTGATSWLYKTLGAAPSRPGLLTAATNERGAVTAQLVFEPHAHRRMPNNDDEIVETACRLREFLGHPENQVYFLTYDAGAAFRARNRGLMPRHLRRKTSAPSQQVGNRK